MSQQEKSIIERVKNLLLEKIRNTVKRALITKGGDDDKDFAIQQVTYLGKVADCEIVFPYGVHANLPPDAILMMFSVGGQDDDRAAIGGTPKDRPRELPVGEMVLYHPPTKSEIRFRNSGDIDIDTIGNDQEGNININAQNTNVNIVENSTVTVGGNSVVGITGNSTVTVGGNATIAVIGNVSLDVTGEMTVTCPTTNWTGDIILEGNLTQTGNITLVGNVDVTGAIEASSTVTGSNVISGGTGFNGHTHGGVTTGGSSTGGPN